MSDNQVSKDIAENTSSVAETVKTEVAEAKEIVAKTTTRAKKRLALKLHR